MTFPNPTGYVRRSQACLCRHPTCLSLLIHFSVQSSADTSQLLGCVSNSYFVLLAQLLMLLMLGQVSIFLRHPQGCKGERVCLFMFLFHQPTASRMGGPSLSDCDCMLVVSLCHIQNGEDHTTEWPGLLPPFSPVCLHRAMATLQSCL